MGDETCNGTGYVAVDGCDMPCNGCRDCDFEWEQSTETEPEPCPF